LQTRRGKRSAASSVKIAVDMVNEGVLVPVVVVVVAKQLQLQLQRTNMCAVVVVVAKQLQLQLAHNR